MSTPKINENPNPPLAAAIGSDQQLKVCISALERIACDYEWMSRKDMIRTAAKALCAIGAWRKVERGEFAQHGEVIADCP